MVSSVARAVPAVRAVAIAFLVAVPLCGSVSRAEPCTEFAQQNSTYNVTGFLTRVVTCLELSLNNCYWNESMQQLDTTMKFDHINLTMINVTFPTDVNWTNVIPFEDIGSLNALNMQNCSFEDEQILEELPVSSTVDLKIVHSGLRQLPNLKLPNSCALKKANFSHNAINNVSFEAFNNIFIKCTALSDIDVTYNRIRDFPMVTEQNATVTKCNMHLEHNPLSCKDNDHLVLKQRTREMLINTPHCDNNGTLVQFWFYNIKLCDVCACSIRSDVYVDCSNRNLKHLPSDLPLKTTHLNVSGNYIASLQTPLNAEGYKTLKELDASWNEIDRVDDYGPHICSLTMLNVSHNRLRNFPEPLVQQLIDILNCRPLLTMGKIMLGDNPWNCDCELLPFRRFLGMKAAEIEDLLAARCNSVGEHLWSLDEAELCPPPSYKFNLWDLAICVMLLLITVIISKTLADHYRQKKTGKLPKFFQF